MDCQKKNMIRKRRREGAKTEMGREQKTRDSGKEKEIEER